MLRSFIGGNDDFDDGGDDEVEYIKCTSDEEKMIRGNIKQG